jgi:hypothetical protein
MLHPKQGPRLWGAGEDPRFDDDDSTNQGENDDGSSSSDQGDNYWRGQGHVSDDDCEDFSNVYAYDDLEEDEYEDSNSYAYDQPDEDDMTSKRYFPKMKRRSQTYRAKRHWINRAAASPTSMTCCPKVTIGRVTPTNATRNQCDAGNRAVPSGNARI